MKKVLVVLSCILYSLLSSQKYHFDTLLEYSAERANDNGLIRYYLRSSSNNEAVMEIGKNSISNEYYGILIDYKNKRFHHYNLSKKLDFKEASIQHDYSYIPKERKNKFSIIDGISLEKELTYRITACRSKDRKCKKPLVLDIELMPFEVDLLDIQYEPFFSDERKQIRALLENELSKLPVKQNYVIKKMAVPTNGYTKESVNLLKKIEKVNITFEVKFIKKKP